MNIAFIDKLIPLAIIPLCFLVLLAGELFGGEVALGVVLAIGISNWMYNRFSSRRRSLEGSRSLEDSRKRFYRFLDSLEPSYEPYLGGYGYLPGMTKQDWRRLDLGDFRSELLRGKGEEELRVERALKELHDEQELLRSKINSGEVVVYLGEECFFCESKFDDVSIHYATNRIKPTGVIPEGNGGGAVDLGAYICNDCRTNIDISKVRRVIRKTREMHDSKSGLEFSNSLDENIRRHQARDWLPSFVYRHRIEEDESEPGYRM